MMSITWSIWEENFMTVMHQCIPTAKLLVKSNVPWMNKDTTITKAHCKKWMVVLTEVIVISVSPKLIFSLETFGFQGKTFTFREIDCIS